MSKYEELRKAGVGAARDARALMAELAGRIEGDAAFGQSVTGVVGTLFTAEIGDASKVLDAIEAAIAILRALLEARTADDEARKTLSRAMALLHPVRVELSRALGRRRDDETAPFLLSSSRVKGDRAEELVEIDDIEDERRGAPREALEMEVGLEGDNTFFTGRTGDLSKGGLFVGTDEPLPVGTELLLSFVLPGGYRVCADAVIAWVRAPRYRDGELPEGMGVRFRTLSPRDAQAIQRYLEQHPPFRYGD